MMKIKNRIMLQKRNIPKRPRARLHLSSLRCFLMRLFQLEWMFLHSAVVKMRERNP